MKFIRPITRRQMSLAVCGLALLAVLTIIPWQVVAQEAKPTTKPPALPEVESQVDANSNKKPPVEPGAKADNAEIEKLLVGTWRDAAGKTVVFQSGGLYQDSGVNIFVATATGRNADNTEYKSTSQDRGGGPWRIEDGKLLLYIERGVQDWTGKTVEKDIRHLPLCTLSILRLTNEYLRLKYTSDHGNKTYFLSREKETPLDEKYASVPADLRELFSAAELTPAEADALVDLLDAKQNDLSDLHIAGRIQQARVQKITLQKLFGMTSDEVDAIRSLLDQHQNSRQSFKELADGGQLLPIEKDAYEKTEPVTVAFDNLATHVPLPAGKMPDRLQQAQLQQQQLLVAPQLQLQLSLQQLSDRARNFIESRIQDGGRGGFGGRGSSGRASGRSGFGGGRGGRADQANQDARQPQIVTAELNETQLSAVNKLLGYLGELANWYQNVVFKNQR